jgi:hypothetical protein
MPLLNGHSDEIISENIRELKKSGYKHKQAIAISLKKANRARKEAKDLEAASAASAVLPEQE